MPDPAKPTVFISYGRLDASEFVDRLATDLNQAGFAVWRDIADLKSPQSWEDQITAALKQCDAVVAVLTPHAVRSANTPGATDDAVCLDELAFARFSPPPTPIVPILLRPCDPPFVIYRLNYLDFVGSEVDEVRYAADFQALIAALHGLAAGQAPVYRTAHFEPLDFDLYLTAKARDFVGRSWLRDDVATYLADAKAKPALVLVGAPGWGKTAFSAQLYRGNPDGRLLAAHFCRADRDDSINADKFIESVVAMVAMRLPDFAAQVEAASAEPPRGESALARFETLFLKPISRLDPSRLSPLPRYILVDSLDEAARSAGQTSIPDLIAQSLSFFPPWLRIIATTRDRPEVVGAFGAASIVRLREDDPRNRADIRLIVDRALGQGTAVYAARLDLAEAVEAKADGNALCASSLASAVCRDGLDMHEIAALPGDIGNLYLATLRRRFEPQSTDWIAAREILEMMLATPEALPIGLIAQALGDKAQYSTRGIVGRLSDLLQVHNDEIRLFHQTLAAFLNDRVGPYYVNLAAGAERLADFAIAAGAVALDVDARAVCERSMRVWIARSENPGRYSPALGQVYAKLFERDFELYKTPDQSDLGEDIDLISALVPDQIDTLIDIVDLALKTAERRSYSAGPIPRVPPAYPNNIKYAKAIQAGMWLTEFAIIWIEELLLRAPEAQTKLGKVWKAAGSFLSFYGFMGDSGHELYGLSGYYAQEGDWLFGERARIAARLARRDI